MMNKYSVRSKCTCRKSVTEGEIGNDESKGCGSRKAGQTDGQGKRDDNITK